MTYDEDARDVERPPICPHCGVTALPGESYGDDSYVCENPECPNFGEAVTD